MTQKLLRRSSKLWTPPVNPPNPGAGWSDVSKLPQNINLTDFTYQGGEDFLTAATNADVGTKYPMVKGYDYAEDTSKSLGRPVGQRGNYRSGKTFSVADGSSVMTCRMYYDQTDAKYYVGCLTPDFEPGWGQLYGKWACRFRRDAANTVGGGYKVAYLLWPAVSVGSIDPKGYTVGNPWDYGEIDLPENLGSTEGYIHFATGSGDNAPNAADGKKRHGNAAFWKPGTIQSNDWHTYSYEWIPGKVTFLVDEQVVLTHTGEGVPYVKMYWALMNETWLSATAPPTDSVVTTQVDWVAQWAYTPGSAAS